MKILVFNCCLIALTLIWLQEEVSCRVFYPTYGGLPNFNDDDDDLGLILTVLLCAARQRNCGYNGYGGYVGPRSCGCSSSGNKKTTIPIPYPIPFPINNPVIIKSESNSPSEDNDYETENETKQPKKGKKTCKGCSNNYNQESVEENSTEVQFNYSPFVVAESSELNTN